MYTFFDLFLFLFSIHVCLCLCLLCMCITNEKQLLLKCCSVIQKIYAQHERYLPMEHNVELNNLLVVDVILEWFYGLDMFRQVNWTAIEQVH